MTQIDSAKVLSELHIVVTSSAVGAAPRYNVAPTDPVWSVRVREPGGVRELDVMRWGLVPSFAKDPRVGSRFINARVETLHQRNVFRDALPRRRCLIVADGFYEWRHDGRAKQPFYVRRADGSILAMAGLWTRFTAEDGEVVDTCTIVTKPAVAPVDAVHDRMPAILPEAHHGAWLEPVPLPRPEIDAMLLGPSPALETVPVSSRVNKVANDGPECIEPVASPAHRGLFD
jgi:putative SOS response-associated peptidase YedK